MLELNNKKISVVGAVRSGLGAAKLAKQLGAVPFVSDAGSEEKLKSSIEVLRKEKIDFEIGNHTEKVFNCDFMVVSPGVPSDSEIIKDAKKRNIKIISEVEFASSFCRANVIAITGTNGKTTTTSLCDYLFNECGVKSYSAGNIGLAFSEIAIEAKENEFISLEVSSFQLDLIDNFKPKVAMILNITPDHLNRYENNVEKYASSKLRIFENQDNDDYLILSKDSDLLNHYFKKAKSKIFFFSTTKKVSNGCYLENDEVRFVKDDLIEFSCKVSDIFIKGEHNIQNAMAVIISAKIFNLENEMILGALKSFKGVEHRLELVRVIEGIKFINDSKATNIDSVVV
nr:UDP-N-acetylmuramoyl-L-alanine--D-glutamate ligase [Ignavibacterium sp.]